MNDIISLSDSIKLRFPKAFLRLSEPMSRWTSFRIGGPADALFIPRYIDELSGALQLAHEHNVRITIIGNGTNLLVRDGGIRGLTIRICANGNTTALMPGHLSQMVSNGSTLSIGAGAILSSAANMAAGIGLSGLEALSGIPGAVGGAALMNAGAYDHDMSDVVESVSCVTYDGKPVTYDKSNIDFTYRGSRMMDDGAIILRVIMKLNPDDPAKIAERISEYTKRRRSKQPLADPSAGSFFKRPAGHFAGKLIEDAGLKGLSVGDAMISQVHAGFVINAGNAKACDVINLSNKVIAKVYKMSGITLEPEVRIIGEDDGP